MNVISLKDYAKQNNVTYEAVRQQVVRYADELGDHIIRDGRQQLLDDEAVAFLDAKRQKNPVVIIQQDKDELIEQLREEKETLLTKIALLSEWKADNAVAIAEANQRQQLLEESKKQIETLKAQNADLSGEKAKIDKEAQEARETAQKVIDELSGAYEDEKKRHEDEEHLLKQRAEAAEKKIQELENRNLWDYLTAPFRKKHKEKQVERT